MVNDICLQCRKKPKRKNYQFCSKECTVEAARQAPKLLKIPTDHVMYEDVSKGWRDSWNSNRPIPTIVNIYLVTWTERLRASFDKHRDDVERRGQFKAQGKTCGNEVKRFRSERRACTIGENGNLNLCNNMACSTCQAIKTGFKSSLEHKRNTPGNGGIRLGRGVYTAPASSKAANYAVNTFNQSRLKATFHTRIILGRPYETRYENINLWSPPNGFDSVQGITGPGSMFQDVECVVYNEHAIRPAYLILFRD